MGRTVVSNSVTRRMMCPLAKYLSCVFNYFLVTTFILVIMSYSAAGEDPTVNGEIVQRILHDGTEGIETRLVRFTMKGREKEVIKCNATSVKSIDWVFGDSKLGKQSIIRCKDKKMKRDSHESDEAFHKELDAPCTVEVKVNDEDEGPNSRMSQLNLVLNYIQEKDFGPYTCITKPLDSGSSDVPFGTTIYVQPTFQVMRRTPDGKPFDKGHRSITVIEGNILSIYCNVTGVNVSHVSMKFYKDDVEINLEEQRKNGEKVQIWSTQFATGFDYLEAEAKHKGSYKCVAHHDGKPSAYQFLVRIKGKLQPLWPFLGICGEVAVLCIIIVVYEKRRNKQELEESDTDGSPDQ